LLTPVGEILAYQEQQAAGRKTTMTRVTTQQSTENMAYVRRLLRHQEPEFSAALELALLLAELELWPPQMPNQTSAHDR
jgi:hypothetical protein